MTTPKARLGKALRAIRSQMRLTLADVSIRTGVAVSTLSKVENGQLSLTYDKLVQLSEGLQVDITALFSADPTVPAAPPPVVTARRSITRRRQGLLVATPNYDYRYLCADLAHKAMVPILITIRARSIVEFSSMSSHSGEEFIYILRGSVEVHTEVYEPTILSAGEAMYIDSTMRHAFVTTRDEPAVMLNVCPTARGAGISARWSRWPRRAWRRASRWPGQRQRPLRLSGNGHAMCSLRPSSISSRGSYGTNRGQADRGELDEGADDPVTGPAASSGAAPTTGSARRAPRRSAGSRARSGAGRRSRRRAPPS